MLTDVTLLIPRAASRTPSPSCGSTFPGIRKTPGVTLPHPQRLKWPCWRNVKCSFTNEDEKSSLYPAQQHGGTNTVSISYDKSAASGNHAPASPFRSHSTQTRAPTAWQRDGCGMITQPQQGSSGFRTATPEEAEEPASFKQHPCWPIHQQSGQLLSLSTTLNEVECHTNLLGLRRGGKRYSKIRKC